MTTTGRFLQKPSLRHVDGRVHVVTEPLIYESADGTIYSVPVGFETDGASVPRFLWWLYPPFGDDYEAAAVLHDFLYAYAETFLDMTRAKADALMNEAMAAEWFRDSGRRVVYRGVRIGGWKAWRDHRREASEGV